MLEKKPNYFRFIILSAKEKNNYFGFKHYYVHLVQNIEALFSSLYVNDLGLIIKRLYKLPDLHIQAECRGGKSPLPSLVPCLYFSRSDCCHLILAAWRKAFGKEGCSGYAHLLQSTGSPKILISVILRLVKAYSSLWGYLFSAVELCLPYNLPSWINTNPLCHNSKQ